MIFKKMTALPRSDAHVQVKHGAFCGRFIDNPMRVAGVEPNRSAIRVPDSAQPSSAAANVEGGSARRHVNSEVERATAGVQTVRVLVDLAAGHEERKARNLQTGDAAQALHDWQKDKS